MGNSWVEVSDAAWRQGFEFLEAWLDGVQRVWMANWRMLEPSATGTEGLRRASDTPWLPHVEAKVIPLRRRSDPLGGEATRVSMRLPLLWPLGGAEALSVEAIMGSGEAQQTGNTETERSLPASQGKASHVAKRAGSGSD
jgi:hypothetical protein